MDDKSKDCTVKLFNKVKSPFQLKKLVFFLDAKNILPGSDGNLKEQLLACSVPLRCTNSDEKQTCCLQAEVGGGH